MIGDIIGRPGRQAVEELLPDLRQQYRLNLVIANAENAAGGLGLTLTTAKELLSTGVDVLTSGNHIWAQKEIIPYLDGRVSAVLGTHTHVATTDTQLLPQGTAYVTDIGMTGPIDSVIGMETEVVIQRFLTGIPHRMSVAKGKTMFNAVLVRVDKKSGRAISIDRIYKEAE